MLTVVSFLLVYLLGGLTLLPIVCLAVLYHAHKTQPVHDPSRVAPSTTGPLELTAAEKNTAEDELKGLPLDISPRAREPDVAAGYFAVCRNYINGGVISKPPERTASQTSLASGETPSVYQSMYRSIFERGKTQSPSLEGKAQKNRKTTNVFFVVIRLGLLMLYDDADQLEVRHVISLENYSIDVYGGGEPLPEGELWVKRNCIRMTRKAQSDVAVPDSRPFYLFSNNCSEKEDFYHAMLLNQGRDNDEGPTTMQFESDHMVKLIRQLHASEDNLQTRWLNALIGRIFLSMYKTALVEHFIRKKINKKLSRVAKPAFISAIQIRDIHLGDSAPFITGPKLREMTRDGDLTLEAEVKYKGNARIDVAAIARIDLGTRFKTREVQILLAVICKSLEGHLYFRVKPPPSNRIWFSFATMPKLDMSVEPVISSRQITYSLILRAIESRIREVLAETLVYPNWDDAPFFDTGDSDVRGGIWTDDSAEAHHARHSAAPTLVEGGDEVPMEEDENPAESVDKVIAETPAEALEKASSSGKVSNRRNRASSARADSSEDRGLSSAVDNSPAGTPKAMRSKSFASAAVPVMNKDPAVFEVPSHVDRQNHSDAAAGLKDISSRSQPNTPTDSPIGSPSNTGIWRRRTDRSMSSASKRSGSDGDNVNIEEFSGQISRSPAEEGNSAAADNASINSASTHKTGLFQKRQTIVDSAAAAKKWGLGFMAKHSPSNSITTAQPSPIESNHDDRGETLTAKLQAFKASKEPQSLSSHTGPIGRGQPLPPVGTPLPGPPKPNRMTWTGPLSMLGKKRNGIESIIKSPATFLPPNEAGDASEPAHIPGRSKSNSTNSSSNSVLPPALTDRVTSPSMEDLLKGSSIPRAIKPILPPRLNENQIADLSPEPEEENVLVIKAPGSDADRDSTISSPIDHEEILSPEQPRSYHKTQSSPDSERDDPPPQDEPISTLDDVVQPAPSIKQSIPRPPSPTHIPPHEPNERPYPIRSNGSFTTSLDEPSPTTPVALNLGSGVMLPRKPRSRQSLIPTPSSSNKTSPIGSTLAKDSRKSSVSSLQELQRRRSSHMYGNT